MKPIKPMRVLLLLLALLPGSAFAVNTVLTGVFDGSEPRAAPMPGTCQGTNPLAYQEVGTISLPAEGTYTIKDAFNFNGVDISALLYQGGFDPADPLTNLVTPNGVDIAETLEFAAGDYLLVVQQWCQNVEGAWSVTFSGPAAVTSEAVAEVPEMTEGLFTDSDPTVSSDCGNSQYQVTGPVQVATGGSYYYTDISIEFDVDMCLQVYSAPFNPEDPLANRVGQDLDDFGSVELSVGQDYYFVAQPLQASANGEFFYVLAPPAPMRINKSLAGGWFDPVTSGQGFLIDVFDRTNQMFVAWFTFDLERPPEGVTAMIGDPGHRWMTAQGPIEGNTAEIDIFWPSGMIFDSADPPLDQPLRQDGSLKITFDSCTAGTVDYDLGSSNVSGQVVVQPFTDEHVELCEEMTGGPGMPGPL